MAAHTFLKRSFSALDGFELRIAVYFLSDHGALFQSVAVEVTDLSVCQHSCPLSSSESKVSEK